MKRRRRQSILVGTPVNGVTHQLLRGGVGDGAYGEVSSWLDRYHLPDRRGDGIPGGGAANCGQKLLAQCTGADSRRPTPLSGAVS